MCHSRRVSYYESWKDGVAAGGGLGFLLGTAIFIGVGVSIGECSANEYPYVHLGTVLTGDYVFHFFEVW